MEFYNIRSTFDETIIWSGLGTFSKQAEPISPDVDEEAMLYIYSQQFGTVLHMIAGLA